MCVLRVCALCVCLYRRARDIPSGLIFFACYAAAQRQLEGLGLSPFLTHLLAGAIAGLPSAAIPTPMDAVKTRVQDPQSGAVGFRECVRDVHVEGGLAAFFDTAPMRMARLSPQLGVTLAIFELLDQRLRDLGLGLNP